MERTRKRTNTKRRHSLTEEDGGSDFDHTATSLGASPSQHNWRQDTTRSSPSNDEEMPADEAMDDDYTEPQPPPVARPSKGKAKRKTASSSQPPKKKARKVLVSDSESIDEYMGSPEVTQPDQEDDDDDTFVLDEKPAKNAKGKGKDTLASKRLKRRAKSDAQEAKSATPESVFSKKRPKTLSKAEESIVDVVGDDNELSAAADYPSTPQTAKSETVPQPKRSKLPTIKKNKLPAATPTTPTSTLLSLTSNKPSQDGLRKNLIGATDVDLSNKNVYQEIFKIAGEGGTPRTGLNRRTKEEERRKELSRLRDEARAKRALEAVHSFDLQGQLDKISRFEEKLRTNHSSALYPNFMAAKWRELWERERRRKERDSQGLNHLNSVEEGEVA